MNKLSLALAILLATATLVAQSHPVTHEKKISDEVTISSNLKVAGNVLPAGRYKIECDHVKMVFTNLSSGKQIDFPCQGQELTAKQKVTELYFSMAPDGTQYLSKLYLRGSNMEHVFAN